MSVLTTGVSTATNLANAATTGAAEAVTSKANQALTLEGAQLASEQNYTSALASLMNSGSADVAKAAGGQ